MKTSSKLVLQLMAALLLAGLCLNWGGAARVSAQTPAQDIPELADGYTSADGRYIVFNSKNYTLLPGEIYNQTNVFVYTVATGAVTRISLQSEGSPLNEEMEYKSISGDGRYVLYGYWDRETYLHDRDTDGDSIYDEPGETSNIQLQPPEGFVVDPNGIGITSGAGMLTPDGKTAMFVQEYRGTGENASIRGTSIFVYDIPTQKTKKVLDYGRYPSMSENGRYITYTDNIAIPGSGDNSYFEVFRWDRDPDNNDIFDDYTQQAEKVSVNSTGEWADRGVAPSSFSRISADGRYVAFSSISDNLVPNDLNGGYDVFLHDFQTGVTSLVSLTNDGFPINGSSLRAVSNDGRYVTFSTSSDAVVAGDDNNAPDNFLRDRLLENTTLVTGKINYNLNYALGQMVDPSLDLRGPTEGGLNLDYSFTATWSDQSGSLPDTLTWEITDQADIIHSGKAVDQVTVRWNSPGQKTIRVTANSADGTVSAEHTFTVYAPPTADFTAQITGPDDYDYYSVDFTNTSTGTYTTDDWDYGGGWVTLLGPYANKYHAMYDHSGSYTISLTVTNPGGSDTISKVIVLGSNTPVVDPGPYVLRGSLGFPTGDYTVSDWGDFDQDGDLDLLVSACLKMSDWWYYGGGCDEPIAKIYENQNGHFTDLHAGFAGMVGYIGWVDLDGDGLLDVAVFGVPKNGNYAEAALYRNLGNGHFSPISASGLAPSDDVDPIFWVDYDQDGDMDAILNDELYQNFDTTFLDTHIRFDYVDASDWGDFDQDGDLDLLTIANPYDTSALKTHFYRNDGGTFTDVSGFGIPNFNGRIVSWVDYDQDGTYELLIATDSATHVYHFDLGTHQFVELPVSLPVLVHSSVEARARWADDDHDGDLDLLADNQLFRSEGGTLVATQVGSSDRVQANHWVDFDGDGDLEIAMSSGNVSQGQVYGGLAFYENRSQPEANPAPSVPGDLTSSVNGGQLTLSWSAATDDLTPSSALTYNLLLRTDSGLIPAVYPNPINLPGNTGESTQVTLPNLPSGKTYYWSVQTVDAGLAVSSFSPEETFTVPAEPIAEITLSGETLGFPGTEYSYSAVISPPTAKMPITYTWQVEGQDTVVHSNRRLPNDTTSFTWDTKGTYTVTVTADNGVDAPVSKQQTVTISNIPRPDFANSYYSGTTAPATVYFSNQTTGIADTWLWDFGDGQTSTEQYPSHVYPNPGTYTVSLTATGPDGTQTVIKKDFLHIYTAVNAHFTVSPGTSGTAPLALTFTNTSTGDIAKYDWDFDDGTTSSEKNPSHTFAMSGSYEVRLNVTGLGRDNDYIYQYITVEAATQADFSMDVSSGVSPLTVHFTNTTQGEYSSSSWNFGDGTSSSQTNPIHAFTALYNNQTIQVTLTINSPTGIDRLTKEIKLYKPVHAAIGVWPAASGPVPLTVYFSNNSSYYTSVTWDFGDGTSSTQNYPQHQYSTKGTYTVTLTAMGQGGDQNSTTQTISVYSPSQAAFHADQLTGLSPLTVHFANDSTGDFTSSAWDFGDGGTSTDATPTHTYLHAGTYTVSLKVNGPGGMNTLTQSAYITATSSVHAAMTPSRTSGTFPLEVTFTSQTSGTYTNLTWEAGDSTAPGSGTTFTHTYTSKGTYKASLTATAPDGSSDVAQVTIQVYAPVNANFQMSPTFGTAPLTVYFSNFSQGDYNQCTWSFGDQTNSASCNPIHTYTQPGTYTVSLTVTGPGGMSQTSQTVQVSAAAQPVQAAFTKDAASGTAPLTVHFTNGSTGDYTSTTWAFGDGLTSREANPVHTYTQAGTFTVTLTVSGPGGTSQSSQTIQVSPAPNLPVHAAFHADATSGPAPLTVHFTNDSTGPYTTFTWDFGDGTTSSEASPSHTYTQPGAYTVRLTVNDGVSSDQASQVDFIHVAPPESGSRSIFIPVVIR